MIRWNDSECPIRSINESFSIRSKVDTMTYLSILPIRTCSRGVYPCTCTEESAPPKNPQEAGFESLKTEPDTVAPMDSPSTRQQSQPSTRFAPSRCQILCGWSPDEAYFPFLRYLGIEQQFVHRYDKETGVRVRQSTNIRMTLEQAGFVESSIELQNLALATSPAPFGF